MIESLILFAILIVALLHRNFQWNSTTAKINAIEKSMQLNHIRNILEITYDVKIERYTLNNEFIIKTLKSPTFYYSKTGENTVKITEDNLFKFGEIADKLKELKPNALINLEDNGY